MPNYSYRVRLLALIDSRPPGPIDLDAIETEFEATHDRHDTPLPSTWKKWMRITLEKLVEEGWVLAQGDQYIASSELLSVMTEEKSRLNVAPDDHDWKTFALIAKRLPHEAPEVSTAVPTPITRKRTSVAVLVRAPSGTSSGTKEGDGTIVVREPKKRRMRYSDPGIGSSSQASFQIPTSATPTNGQPSSRRKSTGLSRARRRHTLAAPPPQPRAHEIPQGISREIQFIPLRQALSERTRRSLRRNQLSGEMNDIDQERRSAQRKNREELVRLRAELEQRKQRVEELEGQLHAARIAPPSETGSIGPGSIGMAPIYEDEGEEGMSPPAFGSSQPPRTPFRFSMGGALLTPALRRFQNEGYRDPSETPISRRDKRIRDLEGQIQALRQDIVGREVEERRRAEEEEIFHEAQEQIFMEARHHDLSLASQAESRPTSRDNKYSISFADDEFDDDFAPFLPADESDDDITPTNDYGVRDHETPVQEDAVPRTHTIIREEATTVTTVSTTAAMLQQENETLQASLEVFKKRVRELEENLQDSRSRPEGRTFGIQTDPVMDAEMERMREIIETLEDKNDVLEQSSLEERNRLWQKIRGHLSQGHSHEGVEELDMAIDEILTNLALAENTADEHHRAYEAVERDLKVERMLAEEKTAEILGLEAEKESLLVQIEKLESVKSELEGQVADFETDEKRLHRELEQQRRELAAEQTELDMKSNELDAAVAEADKLERDLAELGDVLDEEIARFPNAPKSPLSTILEKLQAYADVVREEKESHEANVEALTESIAEKENQVEELQENLRSLSEKQDELEEIHTKLEDLLQKKDKEIEDLKAEINTLKEQLEEAQKSNEKLSGVIINKDQKIASLTDQLTWLTTDLEKIKQKREEAKNTIAELSTQLETKTEEASARGIKLDSDLVTKDQAIASLEVQLATVHDQFSKLNELHVSTQLKVQELSDELAHVKEEAEAQLEELNNELDAKSGEITGLQEGMGTLTNELTKLTTTITQLNIEQKSKEATVSKLNDLVAEKEKTIAELEALNGIIQSKDSIVEEMSSQISGLKQDLDNRGRRLEVAEADLTALRGEVVSKDESVASLSEEIGALTAELDLRMSELKSLEGDVDSLMANRDERINDLTDEISDLKDSIAQKSQEVDDLNSEVSSLNDIINDQVQRIGTLEAEITDFNSVLEAKVAKVHEFERELSSLQDANMEKDESISNLTATIAERDDTVALLRRDVSDRNGVIHANSGTIQSLTGKIMDLDKLVETRDEVINSLNEEILELKQQAASINGDLNTIEGKWESADRKIKEMVENIAKKDQTLADLERLYDVIADKNTQIDKLQDTIDDLNSKLSDLSEKYSFAEGRIEELLEEVSRKQKTIHQLEADLDCSMLRETEANRRYTDAISAQEALRDQLDQMQTVVGELRAMVEDRDAALEESEEAISDLHQKYTDLEATLREQISNHTEQLTDLRAELEQERDEAVSAIQLRLQDALQGKAELESELETTRAEYKEIVDKLNLKVEELEHDLEDSRQQTIQARSDIRSLETAKDTIIANLEQKLKVVVEDKERREMDFEEQLEEKRTALAEKEKELASVELVAQEEKKVMRAELNKLREEITQQGSELAVLREQLAESVEEENRLEEEIQEYEQSTQLLKEEAAKIKTALDSENIGLAKQIDALRLELIKARDELKHEIEVHATSMEEKDLTVAKLEALIDNYKDEGDMLRKRIMALNVTNEKWRQKYNRATEDSSAEFDYIQNNLWKMASGVKERKTEFLERSLRRANANGKEEGMDVGDDDNQEQLPYEGASTAGGLMSPDATTNVSLFSPPTPESSQHVVPLSAHLMRLAQTHGKRRRGDVIRDSGVGVDEEEEDEETERFEAYGSQRRGFLTEQ